MSQERVLKTLTDLGLTQSDAKVYIFLGKRGLQKGMDIAKALKTQKQQIYRSLKNLENKGLVSATLDHPARYSAENFRKVIDLFIRAKTEEAQRLRQSKVSILKDWQSIAIAENEDTYEKFTVIKGRNIIYSKIQQMIQQTKKRLSVTTSVQNLVRADQFGLIDGIFGQPIREGILLRFLIELSEKNMQTMKNLLRKTPKQLSHLLIRVPDLGLKIFNRMIIRDEEEAIFFINNPDSATTDQDDLCLWTNCKSLVYAFIGVFEDLWRNSTAVRSKIVQIETGRPVDEASVIQETESTHKKHIETMLSAEKEIIMMTSAESLFHFWRDKTFTKKWAERGVYPKIMVPITYENLKAAKQLSKFAEVRHIPQGYIETTIVDGKHLFQFKKNLPEGEKPVEITLSGDAFYTNDIDQAGKMVNTINDIWKNAQPLFTSTLESIMKRDHFMPPPLSKNYWKVAKGVTNVEEKTVTITEKDLLNKMMNPDTTPTGENRMYATAALALIHPPDNLNLPDMLIRINHIEKRSSFGEEDVMYIFLWLDTPHGHAFVPAACIGDNQAAVTARRDISEEDPAKQYCKLVKKDEIQIRVFGNSLFCGWAVPIQLYPGKYLMPPACVLVEGYGKIQTKAFSSVLPSGYKCSMEQNYFDAFVTFMHPTSKYSGPGTDGVFIRDLIVTTTPPKN